MLSIFHALLAALEIKELDVHTEHVHTQCCSDEVKIYRAETVHKPWPACAYSYCLHSILGNGKKPNNVCVIL